MEKRRVVIVGRQNVGKSSFINNLIGQESSIVSPIMGTTTDAVKRLFEIPNFATIMLIDTAGIEDHTPLGSLRMKQSFQEMKGADTILLLFKKEQFGDTEEKLITLAQTLKIPLLLIQTFSSSIETYDELKEIANRFNLPAVAVDNSNFDYDLILDRIKSIVPKQISPSLIGDLVTQNDLIMMVAPIDSEAPTGRLILPQVKMIRDALDNNTIIMVVQPSEVKQSLGLLTCKPNLIIVDSQAFKEIESLVDKSIPMTTFSILLARLKGDFEYYLDSVDAISRLKENDQVLLLESCTHHSTCDDIGRVLLPKLLQKKTGKHLKFTIIPSNEPIPTPIDQYQLIIQCGGCIATQKQLLERINPFININIPVTNYGMAITYCNGQYERAIAPIKKSIEREN